MENVVINDNTDIKDIFDYVLSHCIISNEIYNEIRDNCDFKRKKQIKDCS